MPLSGPSAVAPLSAFGAALGRKGPNRQSAIGAALGAGAGHLIDRHRLRSSQSDLQRIIHKILEAIGMRQKGNALRDTLLVAGAGGVGALGGRNIKGIARRVPLTELLSLPRIPGRGRSGASGTRTSWGRAAKEDMRAGVDAGGRRGIADLFSSEKMPEGDWGPRYLGAPVGAGVASGWASDRLLQAAAKGRDPFAALRQLR